LTIASITVLSICLVILGSSLLIIGNVNIFIEEIGGENQVVIFLDESLDEASIQNFNNQLKNIPNIKNITYVTREEALAKYKESLGENQELFSDLEADTLRNSYIFEVDDLSKYEQTMYEVNKIPGIGYTREKKDIVDRILDIRQVLSFFSVWIIAFLFIISVFVITNSVKLSVFSRRLEISVMKCVGATDFFIQLPYFIEGMIIGLFAGGLAILVQQYVYNFVLAPILSDLGFFTPAALSGNFDFYTWSFLIVGAFVGVIGSVYPVKKYLKV
jgi:cell division transport system permease protein